jgi:hypothetical protein
MQPEADIVAAIAAALAVEAEADLAVVALAADSAAVVMAAASAEAVTWAAAAVTAAAATDKVLQFSPMARLLVQAGSFFGIHECASSTSRLAMRWAASG